MKPKDVAKVAWKAGMRTALRAYARQPSLSINNTSSVADGKVSHSEYGQDRFVLDRMFAGKKDGVFVDVGGNHPTDCSNSYLLEQNGWTGVAIEPQAYLRALWPALRTTECLGCVVGPENTNITFLQPDPSEHGLAGVVGFNNVAKGGQHITLPQRRLRDILQERGISHVDYLSVDVEGYEMSVLRSIDFDQVQIEVIGIENASGFPRVPIIGRRLGLELGSNELRRFLRDKGYDYIARIAFDDFFVRRGRG